MKRIKMEKKPETKDVTDAVYKKRAAQRGKGLDDKLSEDERTAFYDQSSERSMAIVLSSIVENRLTELLQLLMRRDKSLDNEMFNPTGPLGPFGTKIRLAYMLRIASPETYKDLVIINKIRNKFAHDLSVTTFENQQISA
jgi:DNA-binding MltR family transcriptional regulator